MAYDPKDTITAFVLRRVPPGPISQEKGASPKSFMLREGEAGLSVYDAQCVSPFEVLEMLRHGRDAEWLKKYPDVESLVKKGWRLVAIPIGLIEQRGFKLGEPDETGHLNILATRDFFAENQHFFTHLIETKEAIVLTSEQCLSKEFWHI